MRHKMYLTRAQTLKAKELALKNHRPVSGFLRDVIAKFLAVYEETEEG